MKFHTKEAFKGDVEGWAVVYYVSRDLDGVRVDSTHRSESSAQRRYDEIMGYAPTANFDWTRVTGKSIFVVPSIPLM